MRDPLNGLMDPNERIVSVWPLAGFEKTLHYRLPQSMADSVWPGSLVRIPIGRRFALGVVFELDSQSDLPLDRLKLVSHVVYPFPLLTKELLQLADWLRRYYGASTESVLETMIPSAARQGKSSKKEKYAKLAKQLDSDELAKLESRAPKQHALYQFIAQQFLPQKKATLLSRIGATASAYKALLTKGFIEEESRISKRVAYEDELAEAEFVEEKRIVLNEEQRQAVESISNSMSKQAFAVHLVQGVTGAGKTEVYLAAMEKALKEGRSVLFLVPEVALTPQTVGRIRSRLSQYKDVSTVVVHSGLSEGERLDAWISLAKGEAQVVVGARSAVFAPARNLGLIIVDEEHEPAYKQDETPRYHGRDVAIYRAFLEGVVCVLGSATPSIESYRNVTRGKYIQNLLTKRVDDRALPVFHIVDMRAEVMRTRKPVQLSAPLVEKLQGRFDAGEQSILFINRRGYSSSMLCQECGHVEECDHCSVPMTYHRSDETLKCHLCGHEVAAPLRCPECQSPKIRWKGMGTQRIEDAVKRVLPRARIQRIDSDTMSRKHLFREILGDFRLGKIDVLVGTQMIAKGLDFPNVTLVGMVDADLSLHIADFRANERTFQLLVQVSGRAGRGDLAGEVIVQTFTPHADPIQFARKEDVGHFLEVELEGRKTRNYPPFRHLIRQIFRGPNEDKVSFFAEQFAKRASNALGETVELRGPAPCAIEKMKDHYRFQIWYFSGVVSQTVATLKKIESEIGWPKDVIQVLDVDPMTLS